MAAIIVVSMASCKKDPEVGGTAVQDMSGDWFVRVNETGPYIALSTFNTSDNAPNLMWVQSTGLKSGSTAIGIKGKVSIDYSSKVMSATGVQNIAATKTTIPVFDVAGKIIANGTKGFKSGTPTDSIYFDLKINSTQYRVSGYHKTGFMEDLP
ncbi:hypothetical protein GS399_02770 [Pedobacter sp. HMF7647]|uniref:Uncharacterized protein n=1 Tax=Hufsiella arboris TaxID=2695275 RepID=A0A7K1Y6Y6_9SPHI|nr:lipid-binding protein [Hufsiella arboris]MXV49879.1 hypothetical protein [Hufsiella arboris]